MGHCFHIPRGVCSNRYYEPGLGRFTSPDPMGYAAMGMNFYNYAGSDPVNNYDPMGLDYVKVEGSEAFWVVQYDGWTNSDTRKVWLGSVSGGRVNLSGTWGGGYAALSDLITVADNFWNEYPDISALGLKQQNNILGGVIGRVRRGEGLEAHGAAYKIGAGAGEGLKGGASITANTLTFGGTDYIGTTESDQYQGGAYTGTRVLATVGRESLLTAATLGTAQLARAGSQGSLYAYQTLQVVNSARSGYNIGEGTKRVAEGDLTGGVQVAAGLFGFSGSITLAASNASLNSIAGIGSSQASKPVQAFLNWWSLGAEGDAAFRSMDKGQQVLSEIGKKALPTPAYQSLQGATAAERGAEILGKKLGTAIPGALRIHPLKILELLKTGPTPGVREYGSASLLIFESLFNVEDAYLNQEGGSR